MAGSLGWHLLLDFSILIQPVVHGPFWGWISNVAGSASTFISAARILSISRNLFHCCNLFPERSFLQAILIVALRNKPPCSNSKVEPPPILHVINWDQSILLSLFVIALVILTTLLISCLSEPLFSPVQLLDKITHFKSQSCLALQFYFFYFPSFSSSFLSLSFYFFMLIHRSKPPHTCNLDARIYLWHHSAF